MIVPLFLLSNELIDIVLLASFIELGDNVDVDLDNDAAVEEDVDDDDDDDEKGDEVFDVDIDLVCPTYEDVPHEDPVVVTVELLVDEPANDVIDLLCETELAELLSVFDVDVLLL